jgi:hypothetical protein
MPTPNEQAPEALSKKELGVFMLDFLRRTSTLQNEYRKRLASGAINSRDISIMQYELSRTPDQILADSQATINACLSDLGGIQYVWTEASSGERLPCRLISWQGNDPNEPGIHLWHAEFAPPRGLGQITVAAARIDDIESHFLSHDLRASTPAPHIDLSTHGQSPSSTRRELPNRVTGLS